jgi:hypothetical protein
MATILDDELLAGAVRELESCNDIIFALHLKIVRGQIALTTGGIHKGQGIHGITAVEETLIIRIGCPHFILIVHVAIRGICSHPWIRVVLLDGSAGSIVASHRGPIVAGEAG